jgi:hypothetical protein
MSSITYLTCNASELAVLAFYSDITSFVLAIATTPDTPSDRVEALRGAFDKAFADAYLQAEAQKRDLELRPMPVNTLQA